MAIDILVTDGISQSVEDKLNAIGNAARYASEQLKRLQQNVDNVKTDRLASISANTVGTPRRSGNEPARPNNPASSAISRAISAATGKYYESANVTAAKELQKRRDAVADVFNKGMQAQEKQNDKIISDITKATSKMSSKASTISAINDNTGANLRQMANSTRKATQQMYDDLFSAKNIKLTTSPISSKALTQAISDNTGTAIKQSSATAQKQMQQMYNNLFSTQTSMSKAAQQAFAQAQAASNAQSAPRNLATYVTQTQVKPQSSQAQYAAQQASLEKTFSSASSGKSVLPNTTSATNGWKAFLTALNGTNSAASQAAAGVTKVSSAMGALEKSVSFLRSDGLRWASAIAGLAGASLTAGAIIQMSDAYTRVQNRLQLVATSQGQVNTLTDEMAKIANNSRQPLEDTAKTFARIDLATKQLGVSQKDSIQVMQNVARAMKLGGASAGEQAGAMLQLSQAFNKGKLDGDEFRSVMENAPVLADAFAAKLKVSRSQLLMLAPTGVITGKVMTEALLSATDSINKAFEKMTPTIEESFTVMRNNFTMFFGKFEKEVGLTGALSSAIIDLSNHLNVLLFVILAATPLFAAFFSKLAWGGLVALGRYALSAAASISAMRSPINILVTRLGMIAKSAATAFGSIVAWATRASTSAWTLSGALTGVSRAMVVVGTTAGRVGAMVLAAFSFGNILLVITTLIAAVLAFGDQWTVSAKDGITARDVLLGAWDEFKGFMVDVFNTVYDAVFGSMGGVEQKGMSTSDKLTDAFMKTGLAVAVTIDAMTTLVMNLINVFKSIIYFFGDTIYNVTALIANSITSLVNETIDAMNSMSNAANTILDWTGLSDTLGHFGELGHLAGMAYKQQFKDSMNDYKMYHGVADSISTINENVMARAKARADQNKKDALRPSGKDTVPHQRTQREITIDKAIKEEERAAKAAKEYGDARAVTNKIDAINISLTEQKNKLAPLNANERARVANAVLAAEAAKRLGKAQDELFNAGDAHAAQEYNAAIQAAENMYSRGAIGAQTYAGAIQQAKRAYAEATDASYKYQKSVSETQMMSGKSGAGLEAAQAILTATNDALANHKAVPDDGMKERIAGLVKYEYYLKEVNSAYQSIASNTVTVQEQSAAKITALSQAYKQGIVSVGEYQRALEGVAAASLAASNYKSGITDPTAPFRQGMYQLAADMPTLGKAMADAITSTVGQAIDSLSDGIAKMIVDWNAMSKEATDALGHPASTLETMRYALSNIAKQIGQDLVAAIIKMGIQWAIQAAMRKTLEAEQAAQATATAATTAAGTIASATAINAAAAPAAINVSIMTEGAAALAGQTAYMEAMGASKIGALAAFADGSDVIRGAGTSRSDSMLAWVSNGEMVMNAEATKNNLSSLRAMQSGATLSNGNAQDNSVHITVNVDGNGNASTETKGNTNNFAKELASTVQGIVDKRLNQLSKQGQPLAGKS